MRISDWSSDVCSSDLATTSLFPYDDNMAAYLRATDRAAIADAADAVAGDLRADDHVVANPGDYFDQVIEIDLDTLGPMINGPPPPDRAHHIPELGEIGRAPCRERECQYR